MNTKWIPRSFLALFLLGAANAQAITQTEKKSSLSNATVSTFQQELLDLAFQAASAFPTNPHIKNRCRAQEEVVAACLKLGQAKSALQYLEKIDNWRRGSAYADLAYFLAERGETDEVPRLLDLANKIAEKPLPTQDDEPEATALNWQRDRIRVKIARTHALLGQMQQAAQFEKDANESEQGKVDIVRAIQSKGEDFEKQILAIEKAVATGNFELTRNALEACAQLFRRFYVDTEKRGQAEKTIKSSWTKLPIQVRIELMMQMTEAALERSDRSKALALVNETKSIFESTTWRSEDRVATMGKIARLRFLAGEAKEARTETDAAYALYGENRENIVNIYRAQALRSIAEAYHVFGDAEASRAVYMHAIAEGLENPNSRPRAEDISATCRSMALYRVEPDEELWTRLRQVVRGLGQPW